MTAELEMFKRQINLVEFAGSMGYELLQKESSRHSKVMRGPSGKIVIATDAKDGHGIYFSVGSEQDSGTIIDFLQRRGGGNLGQIRKRLRSWLGVARPLEHQLPAIARKPLPIPAEVASRVARWCGMPRYSGEYLRGRGIDDTIVLAFGVRQDRVGHACIPHQDRNGEVAGWEVKGPNFTRFSDGGAKGLTVVGLDDGPVCRVVITESGIDAMSYAQMHGKAGDVFVSTAGQCSPGQLLQVSDLLVRHAGAQLVLATDADEAGDVMAVGLSAMAPAGTVCRRERAVGGKDWNELLQVEATPSVSTVRPLGR